MTSPEFRCLGRVDDVIIFADRDGTVILPVWARPEPDRGSRPSDGDVLATFLAAEDVVWEGEIVSYSRGHFTAGLVAGDRYIDCRPSTLARLDREGVLRRITVRDDVLRAAAVPVDRATFARVCEEVRRGRGGPGPLGGGAVPGDDDVLRGWPGSAVPAELAEWTDGAARDASDRDFAELWEALGFAKDDADWLGDVGE
ncbi:hypothetical protein [Corynebacterium bovis]|uniref:Uncharacterized protein n=1 Tax=Corynebacterium bovis DSM 20582 = CIP 54.80 TaxID=927655 RepID=A0A8I0CN90_9CORY|nr:hypothetical protein [Corynebacterium bovis]MBB3115170.1 hypothetical protein [Corynebacterium bovis DSM 20582 = CIP 54.80]QQC47870.1 hypothetical protein I6I09_02725 [Corynebacterium bovis]RRO79887.1 hypothetical protein CXF38_08140 [Corynebacterium bovis]RRO92636.1 hypothetical protein CXF45_01010 [Corynebacterium bovis]RRO95176.1 hypothetical protein CXF29_05440 [Corynebacterium bovis]